MRSDLTPWGAAGWEGSPDNRRFVVHKFYVLVTADGPCDSGSGTRPAIDIHGAGGSESSTKEAKMYIPRGEDSFFQYMVLGKLDRYTHKNEIRPCSHSTYKPCSTWIGSLNVRSLTIQTLGETEAATL